MVTHTDSACAAARSETAPHFICVATPSSAASSAAAIAASSSQYYALNTPSTLAPADYMTGTQAPYFSSVAFRVYAGYHLHAAAAQSAGPSAHLVPLYYINVNESNTEVYTIYCAALTVAAAPAPGAVTAPSAAPTSPLAAGAAPAAAAATSGETLRVSRVACTCNASFEDADNATWWRDIQPVNRMCSNSSEESSCGSSSSTDGRGSCRRTDSSNACTHTGSRSALQRKSSPPSFRKSAKTSHYNNSSSSSINNNSSISARSIDTSKSRNSSSRSSSSSITMTDVSSSASSNTSSSTSTSARTASIRSTRSRSSSNDPNTTSSASHSSSNSNSRPSTSSSITMASNFSNTSSIPSTSSGITRASNSSVHSNTSTRSSTSSSKSASTRSSNSSSSSTLQRSSTTSSSSISTRSSTSSCSSSTSTRSKTRHRSSTSARSSGSSYCCWLAANRARKAPIVVHCMVPSLVNNSTAVALALCALDPRVLHAVAATTTHGALAATTACSSTVASGSTVACAYSHIEDTTTSSPVAACSGGPRTPTISAIAAAVTTCIELRQAPACELNCSRHPSLLSCASALASASNKANCFIFAIFTSSDASLNCSLPSLHLLLTIPLSRHCASSLFSSLLLRYYWLFLHSTLYGTHVCTSFKSLYAIAQCSRTCYPFCTLLQASMVSSNVSMAAPCQLYKHSAAAAASADVAAAAPIADAAATTDVAAVTNAEVAATASAATGGGGTATTTTDRPVATDGDDVAAAGAAAANTAEVAAATGAQAAAVTAPVGAAADAIYTAAADATSGAAVAPADAAFAASAASPALSNHSADTFLPGRSSIVAAVRDSAVSLPYRTAAVSRAAATVAMSRTAAAVAVRRAAATVAVSGAGGAVGGPPIARSCAAISCLSASGVVDAAAAGGARKYVLLPPETLVTAGKAAAEAEAKRVATATRCHSSPGERLTSISNVSAKTVLVVITILMLQLLLLLPSSRSSMMFLSLWGVGSVLLCSSSCCCCSSSSGSCFATTMWRDRIMATACCSLVQFLKMELVQHFRAFMQLLQLFCLLRSQQLSTYSRPTKTTDPVLQQQQHGRLIHKELRHIIRWQKEEEGGEGVEEEEQDKEEVEEGEEDNKKEKEKIKQEQEQGQFHLSLVPKTQQEQHGPLVLTQQQQQQQHYELPQQQKQHYELSQQQQQRYELSQQQQHYELSQQQQQQLLPFEQQQQRQKEQHFELPPPPPQQLLLLVLKQHQQHHHLGPLQQERSLRSQEYCQWQQLTQTHWQQQQQLPQTHWQQQVGCGVKAVERRSSEKRVFKGGERNVCFSSSTMKMMRRKVLWMWQLYYSFLLLCVFCCLHISTRWSAEGAPVPIEATPAEYPVFFDTDEEIAQIAVDPQLPLAYPFDAATCSTQALRILQQQLQQPTSLSKQQQQNSPTPAVSKALKTAMKSGLVIENLERQVQLNRIVKCTLRLHIRNAGPNAVRRFIFLFPFNEAVQLGWVGATQEEVQLRIKFLTSRPSIRQFEAASAAAAAAAAAATISLATEDLAAASGDFHSSTSVEVAAAAAEAAAAEEEDKEEENVSTPPSPRETAIRKEASSSSSSSSSSFSSLNVLAAGNTGELLLLVEDVERRLRDAGNVLTLHEQQQPQQQQQQQREQGDEATAAGAAAIAAPTAAVAGGGAGAASQTAAAAGAAGGATATVVAGAAAAGGGGPTATATVKAAAPMTGGEREDRHINDTMRGGDSNGRAALDEHARDVGISSYKGNNIEALAQRAVSFACSPFIIALRMRQKLQPNATTVIDLVYYLGRPFRPLPRSVVFEQVQSVLFSTPKTIFSPYPISSNIFRISLFPRTSLGDKGAAKMINEHQFTGKTSDGVMEWTRRSDTVVAPLTGGFDFVVLHTPLPAHLGYFFSAERHVDVSGGGDIVVSEKYRLHNDAAALKGGYNPIAAAALQGVQPGTPRVLGQRQQQQQVRRQQMPRRRGKQKEGDTAQTSSPSHRRRHMQRDFVSDELDDVLLDDDAQPPLSFPASQLLFTLTAVLPAQIYDLHFFDFIGNVTSSYAHRVYRSSSDEQADDTPLYTHFQIYPRFPLVGGWNTDFQVQYTIPVDTAVSVHPTNSSRFTLDIALTPPFRDIYTEDLLVSVLLPSGAKEISVSLPRPAESSGSKNVTMWLDYSATHVLVQLYYRSWFVPGGKLLQQKLQLHYYHSPPLLSRLERHIQISLLLFILLFLYIICRRLRMHIASEGELQALEPLKGDKQRHQMLLQIFEDYVSNSEDFLIDTRELVRSHSRSSSDTDDIYSDNDSCRGPDAEAASRGGRKAASTTVEAASPAEADKLRKEFQRLEKEWQEAGNRMWAALHVALGLRCDEPSPPPPLSPRQLPQQQQQRHQRTQQQQKQTQQEDVNEAERRQGELRQFEDEKREEDREEYTSVFERTVEGEQQRQRKYMKKKQHQHHQYTQKEEKEEVKEKEEEEESETHSETHETNEDDDASEIKEDKEREGQEEDDNNNNNEEDNDGNDRNAETYEILQAFNRLHDAVHSLAHHLFNAAATPRLKMNNYEDSYEVSLRLEFAQAKADLAAHALLCEIHKRPPLVDSTDISEIDEEEEKWAARQKKDN